MSEQHRRLISEIRQIIQEELGIIFGADVLASEASKISMQKVFRKPEPDEIGFIYSESFTNDELLKKFSINKVIISIFSYKIASKKPNNIGGGFIGHKTTQYTLNSKTVYDVIIEVRFYNWDQKTNLSKEIESVISHELNHACMYVKKINKKSTTKILNVVQRYMKMMNMEDYKYYPEFKEFMNVFYLNLPEERNARIQQLYTEMKEYINKDMSEIILAVKNLAPYHDFNKMAEFNSSIFNNTPELIKESFLEDFNQGLQNFKEKYKLKDDEINYPKNPNRFFKFWEEQFHKNAKKLRFKAIKMAAGIKNMMLENDSDGIKQISVKAIEVLFDLNNPMFD